MRRRAAAVARRIRRARARVRAGAERGAAPVEFALVMVILLPLFASIFQLGIFLHVRNTLVACAHEGARIAANFNGTLNEGEAAAEACAENVVSASLVDRVQGSPPNDDGLVTMRINARMPGLGWLGAFPFEVAGRAVQETVN